MFKRRFAYKVKDKSEAELLVSLFKDNFYKYTEYDKDHQIIITQFNLEPNLIGFRVGKAINSISDEIPIYENISDFIAACYE